MNLCGTPPFLMIALLRRARSASRAIPTRNG